MYGRVSRARLWFLVNSLAPYGAETFVLRHATHADRARFDVTVCQLGGPTTLAPQLEVDLRQLEPVVGAFEGLETHGRVGRRSPGEQVPPRRTI